MFCKRYYLHGLLCLAILFTGFVAIYVQRSLNHQSSFTGKWQSLQLATVTEHAVTVVIYLENTESAGTFLAATYTPLNEGFHFYSKDLPRNGLNGLGRPTLLELVPHSHLRVLGPLVASVPVIQDVPAGLSQSLPIYPNGPVTLRLPITLPQLAQQTLSETVALTYMTCSDKGLCTPPVVGKIVTFPLPINP